MPPDDESGTSTKPYLIRALHEWCTDNGFVPYLAVRVGPGVQVPREYVKNNEIVLNVGYDATGGLRLGNEFIEFKARFGGVPRDILVPVEQVLAIYARENGQGMAFPVPDLDTSAKPSATDLNSARASRSEEAAPAAPAAARGLRLASVDGEGAKPQESAQAPAQPTQESPANPSAESESGGPDDTPPGSGGGSAAPVGRPMLKRIK